MKKEKVVKEKVSFTLDKRKLDRVKKLAEEDDRNLSSMLTHIISQYLKNRE